LVEVWLPYGKTEVCVRVPTKNLLGIIEPNDRAGAQNPQAEIENALMNPFGKERLAGSVKPGEKVCIALRDYGAPTNQMVISAILNELTAAGARDEDIMAIFAHDPLQVSSVQGETPPIGEDLSAKIGFSGQDCEAGEHVYVGKTSRGTDVYLNKGFAESDVKIVAGLVEPHPFAGYCGSQEVVLPGISNTETVRQNLSLGLDAKAVKGLLEGNPVHQDMVEAAQLADVDFTLNIVRNGRFQVVAALAGELSRAFDEAVKLAEEIYRVHVEDRADVVFVSPGGHPFDANLSEASKCIDAALGVAKRGKVIVLVAECFDGYGQRDFYEAMSRYRNPKDLEKSLKKHFTVGGLMAHRLMTSLQKSEVVLVSAMPDYYVSGAFRMKPARTANEAFRLVSDIAGKNGQVSFVPHGNLTVPLMKAAKE